VHGRRVAAGLKQLDATLNKQVWKIEDFLAKWEGAAAATAPAAAPKGAAAAPPPDAAAAAIGAILLREIDSYRFDCVTGTHLLVWASRPCAHVQPSTLLPPASLVTAIR